MPIIASQLFTAGDHIYGPATKVAGQNEVALVMTAPTDWQTGPVGRKITVTTQRKKPGAAGWEGIGISDLVSPNMGHGGSMPTLLTSNITGDPVGTQYQLLTNFSGDVTCGWDFNIT